VDEGDLQSVTFKVGRLHLANTKYLEVPGGCLKTRESQSSTGIHGIPKAREALTRVPKRTRSEGSTLIKEVNPLQRPRDSVRPGTYREALIMTTNKRAL
jgi:hypothetical protein